MNETERHIEVEYSGTLLRLTVRQMQQLFDCILSERESDAYKMFQLFLAATAQEDNERRIRDANFQEQHAEEVMRKDAG